MGLHLPKDWQLKKNPETEKDKECLKLLLAQISGIKKLYFDHVTCDNFGKLLAWFGPGLEYKSNETTNFMHRMRKICSEPWFHGNIDNADAIINGKSDHFLVRLSTQAGCYTIQTPDVRVRIIYKHHRGFQEEKTQKPELWFPDLSSLIKSFLGTKISCAESEFAVIYGNKSSFTSYSNTGIMEALAGNDDLVRRILAHTDKKND